MDKHSGLINFLQKDENDKVTFLGSIKTETSAVIALVIVKMENLILLNVVSCEDDEEEDEEITYLSFSYEKQENYEDTLKLIVDDFDNVLEKIHKEIIGCLHCGIIFSGNNETNTEFGFKDKLLCCNCGLQNLYDKKYSEDNCAICLEAIGFGEFVTICGNIKHKIHIGCGKTLSICPLCRNRQEISFVINEN